MGDIRYYLEAVSVTEYMNMTMTSPTLNLSVSISENAP